MSTVLAFVATTLLGWTFGDIALSAQVVEIADAGLEAAVRQALAKPSGALTAADLATLTSLTAFGCGIKSVDGIEWATNLTTLDLRKNELDAITLPTGFSRLKVLWLGGNRLTNIILPDDLVSLDRLALWGNRLSLVTLPANLRSLIALSVSDNRLTEFRMNEDLSALRMLDLSNNRLTNFTAPIGLSQLDSLDLSRNALTSVRLSADMGRLEELDLGINELADFTLPDEVRSMRYLTLQRNRLSSFQVPAGATNLTWLNLWRNDLRRFDAPDDLRLKNLIISASVMLVPPAAALLTRGTAVFYPEPVVGSSRAVDPPSHRLIVYGDKPAAYVVLRSLDLVQWEEVGQLTITLPGFEGAGVFTESSQVPPQRAFYRVRRN